MSAPITFARLHSAWWSARCAVYQDVQAASDDHGDTDNDEATTTNVTTTTAKMTTAKTTTAIMAKTTTATMVKAATATTATRQPRPPRPR